MDGRRDRGWPTRTAKAAPPEPLRGRARRTRLGAVGRGRRVLDRRESRATAAVREPGAAGWTVRGLGSPTKLPGLAACAVDDRGNAVIAIDEGRRVVVRTLSGGKVETAASLPAGRESWVALAVAPDGGAVVAYSEATAGGSRLRLVERAAGGTFSPPRTIATGFPRGPEVVVDAAAMFTIAWTAVDRSSWPLAPQMMSGTPGALGPAQAFPAPGREQFTRFELAAAAGRVLIAALLPGRHGTGYHLATALRAPDGAVSAYRRLTPVNDVFTGLALAPDGRAALGWQAPDRRFAGRAEAVILASEGSIVSRRFLSGHPARDTRIVPIATPGGFLFVWTEPTCSRALCRERIRIAAYR